MSKRTSVRCAAAALAIGFAALTLPMVSQAQAATTSSTTKSSMHHKSMHRPIFNTTQKMHHKSMHRPMYNSTRKMKHMRSGETPPQGGEGAGPAH